MLLIQMKSFLLNKNEYIFGNTKEIMTEKTIKKYFFIDSKLIDIEYQNTKMSSFVFLDKF